MVYRTDLVRVKLMKLVTAAPAMSDSLSLEDAIEGLASDKVRARRQQSKEALTLVIHRSRHALLH